MLGVLFSVVENQMVVFIGVVIDDDGDFFVYLLLGMDVVLFSIDGIIGVVIFILVFDWENLVDGNFDNVYEINLVVSDGVEQDVQVVMIIVMNIDEVLVFVFFVSFNVVEGQIDVFMVDVIDFEGNVIIYLLFGVDVVLFSIDLNMGEVIFFVVLDFDMLADVDMDNVYELIVIVDDGVIIIDQNVSVIVIELMGNVVLVFVIGIFFLVFENQIFVYVMQWINVEEMDIIIFVFFGMDVFLFQVDSMMGEVSFINVLDFEVLGDGNLDNVYEFILIISDGFQDVSQNILVMVDDVSDGIEVLVDDIMIIFMVFGGSYVGNLEMLGDQDWISIELVVGQCYEFNLEGMGVNDFDDLYLCLYDFSGMLIVENDDILFGIILDFCFGFIV